LIDRVVRIEEGRPSPAAAGGAAGWLPAGLLPTLLSFAAILALWVTAAAVAQDARLMPGPLLVMERMAEGWASGDLPRHLMATLGRVAAAFLLAMSIGTALGILMGRSRLADQIGQPWLLLFLNMPALVVIILAYIWIGLVEAAAIFAVAINKIPNVAVTVREGAKALDSGLGEMAQVFRLDRGRVLRHVVLPQLYPYIAAAARSGLALVWKIVLVVELLGRSSGIGFKLGLFFQFFDVASILAYALAFIAIVQLIEWGILQPLDRAANRWRR
jgi:NitT/TauT family transport system permease protein